MQTLLKIDNYAINVDQIQFLQPNVQNNRTNIHFYDRIVAVSGSVQEVAAAIDKHVAAA